MFQEDVNEINKSNKAAGIPAGKYEADITGVTTSKAKGDGKSDSWIVTFSISDGDYEGCEYTSWVTLSPKAAGIRARFYRNIGYETPEDGAVDENDFIGQPALINIEVVGGAPRISNNGIERSARGLNDQDAPDYQPI